MKRYFVDKNDYLSTEDGIEIFPLNMNIKTGRMSQPRILRTVSRVIHGKESYIDLVDPDWCFHSLRHTHASDCLAAGMSPVSVQKRLGHRSLNTTFKTYIHETETQVTESRDILEKMYKLKNI
jgi:integrase